VGWGQFPAGVSASRGADRYLNSARLLCMWERTSPTSVCRSDPGYDLAHLRQRFVLGSHGLKQGQLAPFHCWLTNRINIPTAIKRPTRLPTTNDRARLRRFSGFDPAPFCAAPMPSQKSRLPIEQIPRCSQIGLGLHHPQAICLRIQRSSGASCAADISSSAPFKRGPRSAQDSNRPNH
jgi:hypothetical protein